MMSLDFSVTCSFRPYYGPGVDLIAVPIQSPAKCEVRSVIRFLNVKDKRPAEIYKQIVAVCDNVMNRQNVTKWYRELSEGRTDVQDEQRSGRPSLISLVQRAGGRLL